MGNRAGTNRSRSFSPANPPRGRFVTTKRGLSPPLMTSALPITRRDRLQRWNLGGTGPAAGCRVCAQPAFWHFAKRHA
jgi:hypothetical protein